MRTKHLTPILNYEKKTNGNSKRVQFPVNEKLSDGRHRYYVKYGQKIDRLAK